jgi:acetyl-CoA synthetase
MRQGDEWPKKSDLSSLRLLGSVGEPINPEAWIWYHQHIGGGPLPIVDTWWQTETGAIMMTTLPGALLEARLDGPADVRRRARGREEGRLRRCRQRGGLLVLKRPWPSMLRTVWGDDERFQKQYWSEIPGVLLHGRRRAPRRGRLHWVVGRIDDVLNVAGHRIGTAEIESALVSHPRSPRPPPSVGPTT